MVDAGDVRGDPVELIVGGRRSTGWTSVRVVQALNSAAGAFSLELPLRRSRSAARSPAKPQDPVRLAFAGEDLVNGHVDRLELGADEKRAESVSLRGRDLSADLIDSSVTEEPTEFLRTSLQRVIERIAAPFSVPLTFPSIRLGGVPALSEAFTSFKVTPGEKAWAAIERGLRLRGLLASPAGDGGLAIQIPADGRADVELVEGVNVARWRLVWDDSKRYATYLVLGQRPGDDEAWGVLVAQVKGEASDGSVTRPRKLLVFAESAVDEAAARARAEWEAIVHAARADAITIDVPHWRQLNRPSSRLWRTNELVLVRLPSAGIEERTMLVDRVEFTRSRDGGEQAQLTLVREDAYKPQQEIPRRNPFRILDEEEIDEG